MASSSRADSSGSSSVADDYTKQRWETPYKETLLQRLVNEKVLKENFSKELAALSTNVERIDKIYGHMKEYLEKSCEDQDFKCDKRATQLIEAGETCFSQSSYLEALKYYTKSIATAATQEVVTFGLINRSQALLTLGFGTQCKSDILKIRKNDFPVEYKDILRERFMAAKLIKKTTPARHECVPPIIDRNTKIQAASSSIEMRVNEMFGRHMVATRDIKLGEVLGVEEAIVANLFVKEVIHCHECFRVCYNAIPCDVCTQVVYCSKECKVGARSIYHKYECVVRRKLDLGSFKAADMLALKLTCAMKDEYLLLENYKVPDEYYKSDHFQEVCTMQHHLANFPHDRLLDVVYRGAFIYHILKTYTDFFDVHEPEKYEEIFKDLIVVNRARVDTNQCLLSELSNVDSPYFEHITYGTALYPLLSLFNHGCYYNVIPIHYGTKIVLRAIGTIKEGEQCFVNYQFRYDTNDKLLREQALASTYNFRCTCRACIHNWPIFPLKEFHGGKNCLAMKVMCLNTTKAIRRYADKMAKQLEKFESKMPSIDFNVLYIGYEFCLRAFGNQRPDGLES